MSISLTVNSRIVADVTVDRVSLSPLLGGFELAFSLTGKSTPDNDYVYWLTPISAQVKLGRKDGPCLLLGSARPDGLVRLQTFKTPCAVAWEFKMPVSGHQLDAIERLRADGDLQFQLGIFGEGGGGSHPQGVHPSFDQAWLTLGRSDWIQQLRAAGAADILLIEVPMPIAAPDSPLRLCITPLKQAQRLFAEGHYAECITTCRKSLEALATLQGRETNWSSSAFQRPSGGYRDMTKDQRELALQASIYHLASLSAHDAAVGFSRHDAKFAITLTAAVLAHQSEI